MSDDILPDSRLQDEGKGNVVVDWTCLDKYGQPKTIRLTLQPIFCFNCGAQQGYVPRDIMSYVSWMCDQCSVKLGAEANHWQCSDAQFWSDVAHEMERKFGRSLSQLEIAALAEQGKLGMELELLARESPYRQ